MVKEGVQVPEELQEAWAAKQDVIVSRDGSRIDFHGGGNVLVRPRHLAESELAKVTDIFVVSLVHHKVTSINVTICKGLTDESVKAIAKGCLELKELNVCGIEKLTDESIKAIAKGCPELRDLNVSWNKYLTEESISAIAMGCPELKELNVSFCSRICDSSIKAIAKGCPDLKELNVNECAKLTDESIKAIARCCPELTELNVAGIKNLTDESIKAIVRGCPALTALNVAGIENLTDESIKAIAKGCPELEELEVLGIQNLADESIKAIAKGCPKLKKLIVSRGIFKSSNLTDVSIKAISRGCPELKELDASRCEHLTDDSITAIAKGCPELKTLSVADIQNLTDESIKAVADGCPKLIELNVWGIHNLTVASMKAIAKGCPELKRLTVSECRISDSWMKTIFEGFPALEEVYAFKCGLASLPADAFARLQHLQVLDLSFNALSSLPPSIVKLTHLRQLDVSGNPLQSPPIDIARQGLDAIKRYFEEPETGSTVSKLLKVVLVGDGEAGKTTLRNALTGRPNPRQEDRTIHLDIEKISLTDDLDINVYDCGGQKEYTATQLPYLTGLALYILVVDAQFASDEHAYAVEDKLHRFLVVLQNRVPGALVLPIVTKVDTVADPEIRCQWLENQIDKWLHDTRNAVCCDPPDSTSCPAPLALLASVGHAVDMRNAGYIEKHQFIPLRVQSPALAVSVADYWHVGDVRPSVRAVQDRIIALTKPNPPLLRSVGQKIPSTYLSVLNFFGAIAKYGDNDRALEALRNNTAHALGETSELSPNGKYRPKDELEAVWNTYRYESNGSVTARFHNDDR